MCVSVDLLVDIFFKSFHIWLYFDLSVNIRQTDRQSRLPLTLVVTDEGNKNNYQRELSCLYKEVMNSMLPPPPPRWQFCRTFVVSHPCLASITLCCQYNNVLNFCLYFLCKCCEIFISFPRHWCNAGWINYVTEDFDLIRIVSNWFSGGRGHGGEKLLSGDKKQFFIFPNYVVFSRLKITSRTAHYIVNASALVFDCMY